MDNTRSSGSQKKYINILTNAILDKDIHDWLDRQPNQSAAVRSAIRLAMAADGEEAEEPTLRELLFELRVLRREVEQLRRQGVALPPSEAEAEDGIDLEANAVIDDLLANL